MIVVMKKGATPEQIEHNPTRRTTWPESPSDLRHGTDGHRRHRRKTRRVPPVAGKRAGRGRGRAHPRPLQSRQPRSESRAHRDPRRQPPVGNGHLGMIAGPCSVESEEQTLATARAVKAAGATALRGGAFKPRTSPYSFQGLKEEGLKILAAARDETGLAVVTEVIATEDVPLVARYADVLQIGARNMQNYRLLEAVGEQGKPVLLKRGPSATLDELLLAAEYILNAGNPNVMLCERGIRTFEAHTRYTLPLATVPWLHERTHLPVVVDPSHGTGHTSLVTPMAAAAVAAGADGLIVEVHPDPERPSATAISRSTSRSSSS